MKRIVVFASGGGSNFEALADKQDGYQIVLLVASKAGIGAITRAQKFNIPVYIYDENTIISTLKSYRPDLICLAGYLRKISSEVLAVCPVMNIHPALLPAYGGLGMYGHHVHEAVVKAGECQSGATVHFVDENYDTGAIILQKAVALEKGDDALTVAKKVLKIEHEIYPLAVKNFCKEDK